MALHFTMIEEIKAKNGVYDENDIQDKEFFIGMMTHCADLNNPSLNYDNYIVWSKLITMEFADQTYSEEKAGVPVTGFLQYKGELAFYKGQCFFLDVLVSPLYKEICNLMPE